MIREISLEQDEWDLIADELYPVLLNSNALSAPHAFAVVKLLDEITRDPNEVK